MSPFLIRPDSSVFYCLFLDLTTKFSPSTEDPPGEAYALVSKERYQYQ